jgi:protein-tyrosine phosphatase
MNKGYIDTHSHILYETDDGPGSIEESIKIIKAIINAGFSTSYATPHNIPGSDKSILLSKSKDRIQKISEILEKQNINYEINTGAENYFDASLNIKTPGDYFIPLGNSDIFLVEIPFIGESSHHIDTLHKSGLRCIIAHVERYMDIVQNPDKVDIFKQAGFMLQMNFGSLIGVYGFDIMKTANYLLKKDAIDVIATDIHDIHHADIILKKGIKRLETLVRPAKVLQFLKDKPYSILSKPR